MRKIFLLLLLCNYLDSFSQVAFQHISLSEALAQAKSEGKLVFLQLESPTCKECTETALAGLQDKELSGMINKAFVPLYVQAKHKDRTEIENRYNSPDGFGTLFIDQNGMLIHKYGGSASFAKKYTEQIDIAFNKAGENTKVNQLEQFYRNGNQSIGLLEQLLLKKKELNLDNSSLLDEYVTVVPADSLSSLHTLRFVASMAPLLGSKADSALRKNSGLFSQAWYSIPLTTRISINSRIIQASLNKAIKEKDKNYAYRVASFARMTVTSSRQAGEKTYTMHLLDFYLRTDNTPSYLTLAVNYYDNFLMTVNVDSVKAADEKMRSKLGETAKKDTIKTDNGYTIRSTIQFAATAQRFTSELKEGARNVYNRTSDPQLLAKATMWVKRGLDFYTSYDALEVYALLLYRQQQKEEAIASEKQAIELKKKMRYSVKENEARLAKMEKGLPID